jgi:hypothetical protein
LGKGLGEGIRRKSPNQSSGLVALHPQMPGALSFSGHPFSRSIL